MYYKNLIGQKIGKWAVLGVQSHGQNKSTKMWCRCECGTLRPVDAYSLTHGGTSHCGKCKRIISEGSHKRCIMKNGASFIFDAEDEQIIREHTWSISRGHARTVVDGKDVYLHQILMGFPDNVEIDHANGNKLDNRRENLRVATHAQNNQNKGLRKDSSTGYKGVCFNKRSGRYIAYINANGKRTYLGYFDDKIKAALAYDRAALKLHGEYAKPNFGEGGIYGEVLELETA